MWRDRTHSCQAGTYPRSESRPNFTGGEVIDLLVGKERLDRKRIDYYLDLFELDPKKCKTYSRESTESRLRRFASQAVFISMSDQ